LNTPVWLSSESQSATTGFAVYGVIEMTFFASFSYRIFYLSQHDFLRFEIEINFKFATQRSISNQVGIATRSKLP